MVATQYLNILMASIMSLQEMIPKEIRNISVLTVADRFIMARDGNITAITAMTAGLTKENWMLILHQAYG